MIKDLEGIYYGLSTKDQAITGVQFAKYGIQQALLLSALAGHPTEALDLPIMKRILTLDQSHIKKLYGEDYLILTYTTRSELLAEGINFSNYFFRKTRELAYVGRNSPLDYAGPLS